MKKIGSLFLLICILNLLAGAGLAGYLLATNRLDKQKASAIVDMLRHQGTPDKFRENLYDILQPASATTSAPASQPAVTSETASTSDAAPGTAQDRINAAHQAVDQESLRLENQAQELRHRQELLVQLQTDVTAKLQKIQAERDAFEKRIAEVNAQSTSDSFQKSLALYNELKTKQVKDLFMPMPPEEVAKFLTAMEPERAAKVISEFKTPDEAAVIGNVLARIRNAGTTSASGNATDSTAVAASPAPPGP